jgi:PAS domain S-box-containing protein
MSNLGTKVFTDTLPATHSISGLPRSNGHSVQFYEDDSFFIEGLSKFIGAAMIAGDFAVVIATRPHTEALFSHLADRGLDLSLALKQGRLVFLGAAETLSQITINQLPDQSLFNRVVGGVIAQLTAAARKHDRRVVAFGEMVGLLCADGKPDAAIQLERFWNKLAETYLFQLHCAYSLKLFSDPSDAKIVESICAEHDHTVPAERYASLTGEEERLRTIVLLQQKAQSLEGEARERNRVQDALQEREEELTEFLENGAIAMHWVAADGTILWANAAELAMLGYQRDEYVGRNISEFHADAGVIEDILCRLSRNESLHDYEARVTCKDGSIRIVRIDSNVFRRNGEFVHTRCFTTDITEKKKAEETLFRLAAIVESSDDAIASKDLNGIITTWNKGAERMFGYKSEEIIGRSVTVLIPPELQHDEVIILAKIRAGQRIEHFQTVRVKKNGERIDVSLTISPVKDRYGNIIGAAKILRDITQEKKLQAALHTSERLASVGRLAATVAHEINNPLEAVTNFIYLAKRQPGLSTKVEGYLTFADQELARVAHIAQQTLGFYRDNSAPTNLVVADVVDDVLTIYERKSRYKGISIQRQIPPGLSLQTLQGEFKQTISNLLANAIDASFEGGKIIIRARRTHDVRSGSPGLRITIADNGIGIPAEHKAKLFAPFFTSKKEVGTGLGLWITKELLEKKGGNIRFRSRDSKPSGTVMSIYLPETTPALAAKLTL